MSDSVIIGHIGVGRTLSAAELHVWELSRRQQEDQFAKLMMEPIILKAPDLAVVGYAPMSGKEARRERRKKERRKYK